MIGQQRARCALPPVVGICLLLAGCGGGGHRTAEGSQTVVSSEQTSTESATVGRIVDPSKVPTAIKHLGLRIMLRPGPALSQFVGAVYGTAWNSHDTSVNFGIFMSGDLHASRYFVPALRKLVPGATQEGSTAGQSFIAITSAGHSGTGRRSEEEFAIATKLQERVSGLAHKALEEEGP